MSAISNILHSALPVWIDTHGEAPSENGPSNHTSFHTTPLEPSFPDFKVNGYIDGDKLADLALSHTNECNTTWVEFARLFFENKFTYKESVIDKRITLYLNGREKRGIETVCTSGILFGNDTVTNINSICAIVEELQTYYVSKNRSDLDKDEYKNPPYTLATADDITIAPENAREFVAWATMYQNYNSYYVCYGPNGKAPPKFEDTKYKVQSFSSTGELNVESSQYVERFKLDVLNVILRFGRGNQQSMFDINSNLSQRVTVYDAIAFCIMREEQQRSKSNPEHYEFNTYRMMAVLCSLIKDIGFTNYINLNSQPLTIRFINEQVQSHYASQSQEKVINLPRDYTELNDLLQDDSGTIKIQGSEDHAVNMLVYAKGNKLNMDFETLKNTQPMEKAVLKFPTMPTQTFYRSLKGQGQVTGLFFSDVIAGARISQKTMRIAGLLPIARMFFYEWFNLINANVTYEQYTQSTNDTFHLHDWSRFDHRLFSTERPSAPIVPPKTPKMPPETASSNSGFLLLILLLLAIATFTTTRKRKL